MKRGRGVAEHQDFRHRESGSFVKTNRLRPLHSYEGLSQQRESFCTPQHPVEKERLYAEMKVVGEYGIKIKCEVWSVQCALAKIRTAARRLLTWNDKDDRRTFQGQPPVH